MALSRAKVELDVDSGVQPQQGRLAGVDRESGLTGSTSLR